ncbi:MAG TPA: YrdB family protein [Ktedonobacteraceae bacterium]|jgi:hypothetical protein|nr:YrdB family protein [Ktedonobacteraceae bacterium]
MFLTISKNLNLALALLLELCVLVALGYWGFQTGQGMIAKIGLGLGAPIVAVIVWAIFGAPRSTRRLKGFGLLILRVLFFGAAALALFAASQHILSVIFAFLVVLNLSLLYLWAQ